MPDYLQNFVALQSDPTSKINTLRAAIAHGREQILPLGEAVRRTGNEFGWRQQVLSNRLMPYFPRPVDIADHKQRLVNYTNEAVAAAAQSSRALHPMDAVNASMLARARAKIPLRMTPEESRTLIPHSGIPDDSVSASQLSWGATPANTVHDFYQPGTNSMSLNKLRTGVSRHELGHWMQHQLAVNNPATLNVRTGIAARRLFKAAPSLATSVFNKNKDVSREFQAHMLAGFGGGRGGAQRAINGPRVSSSHPVENLQAWSEKLFNNPELRQRQDIAAAAMHVIRNYGALQP